MWSLVSVNNPKIDEADGQSRELGHRWPVLLWIYEKLLDRWHIVLRSGFEAC